MVYLIHFNQPIGNKNNPRGQAQHYIGYTDDVPRRLAEHQSGQGAAILRACNEQAIPYSVVRTWDGDRKLERQLKNKKKARAFCPVCNQVH